MAYYGALMIGRLTLTEGFTVKDSGGTRELSVSGQESWPPLPDVDTVRYRGEQLMAMEDQIVPVRFASKSDRDGFYIVSKPSVDYEHYDLNASKCDWSVTLTRLGAESETFFESRLIGGNRVGYYAGNVAERWHSPAASHVGYYTGPNVPGSMIRTGAEGPLTIYRGLAPDVSPQWGATPSTYMRGAVRITVDGDIRTGTTCPNTPLSWTIENTLMRIESGGTTSTFKISSYVSGIYGDTYVDSYGTGSYVGSRGWVLDIVGIAHAAPSYITILRNSPEECVVRATYQTAQGYSTIDYSLRRGSRFVSIFVQHENATTYNLFPSVTTAGTDSGNGYLYETTNDANGNRYVIGSAVRLNVIPGAAQIESVDPAVSFSCFVGVEKDGSAALDGNQAADVAAQWLGTPSESVKAVHR